MMKTTLIIISSVFFALGLAGCKSEEAPKAPEAPAVTEPAPLPPPAQ